ncbi:hypothetical protein [Acinetobacter boissieri]|uniref:Uncharacterized protein n=1 Tax=Acinetobacter boissieri TaxID=1219383 RepID=A0A1G6KCP9_9GAMM|nr:hypothetical protein [Acinetobacter boissieri]SDC28734.1 hypothetical protein SAMN05421733_11612 [Acinetobacter boissieri]
MSVKATGYPDEVWAFLRLAWENTPKITWAALAQKAQDELGIDVPSSSVICRRSKAENWQKTVKKAVKKSNKSISHQTVKKTIKSVSKKQGSRVKNDTNTAESESTENDIENHEKSDTQYVKNDVKLVKFDSQNEQAREKYKHSELTALKVVKKTRNNLAKLSDFARDTLDSLTHVRDELQNMDLKTATDDELQAIKFKMGITSQMIEQNLKQSITLSNLAKSEAMFWGLEFDELKDKQEQQARRTAVMNASNDKLEQAKLEMERTKKAQFLKQLEIIEMARDIEQSGGDV